MFSKQRTGTLHNRFVVEPAFGLGNEVTWFILAVKVAFVAPDETVMKHQARKQEK